MTIRITWLPENPAEIAEPLFAELRPQGGRGAVSFLWSLGLHVVGVWLMATTMRVVNARMAIAENFEKAPVRALQMPASYFRKVSLMAPGRSAPPSTPGAAARKADSPGGAAAQNDVEKPIPADRQGKRFIFPVPVKPKPERQILVQIEPAPEVKPMVKVALPEVMLWQLPVPPKPKEQVVVAHFKPPQTADHEAPSVRPQMNARNQELALAALRLAESAAVASPALPVPVSNTTPIRLLDAIAGVKMPESTGPTVAVADAAHVISIPDGAVPPAKVVVLPPGSQAPPPGTSTGGASGGGTPNGSATRNSTGTGTAGASGPGSGSGGSGNSSSPATRNGTENGLGGVASTGIGPGPSGTAGAGIGNGPPPPNTTRVDRPRDGKYAVVILGASNLDAYPEAAGILSGKLVYSVYIRTGGRKEWILQYCLPKSAEQTVKLRGSAVPIEAPYPFVIYRPNLAALNDPDYLIIHGFITAAGRFDHLSAIGDLDAAGKELLIGALQHWEFRPASRDGEASMVEIALIIPREPI